MSKAFCKVDRGKISLEISVYIDKTAKADPQLSATNDPIAFMHNQRTGSIAASVT